MSNTINYHDVTSTIIFSYEFADLNNVKQQRGAGRSQMWYINYLKNKVGDLGWSLYSLIRQDATDTTVNFDYEKAQLLIVTSFLYKISQREQNAIFDDKQKKLDESLKQLSKFCSLNLIPKDFFDCLAQVIDGNINGALNEANLCNYVKRLVNLQLAIAEQSTEEIPEIPFSIWKENYNLVKERREFVYTDNTQRLMKELL